MNDELVRRSQRGDGDAYGELVHPLQVGLYNLALRTLADAEEAKDVVQDTLTQAWMGLPALREPRTFTSWVYRIAVNVCRNRHRNRNRRPAVALEANVVQLGGAGDPAAALVEREDARRLQTALLELPVDLRVALVLRDVNDLSYAEIAGVLEIPGGTVRSRISRGRMEMRRRLAGDAGATTEVRR